MMFDLRILLLTVILIGSVALPLQAAPTTADTNIEVINQPDDEDNRWAIEIAHEAIDVSVGYNGSTIEVFGSRRNEAADLAIVVEGPHRDITIWQKARFLGAWVNRYFVTFKNMPVYYAYATSVTSVQQDISEIFKTYNIGTDVMVRQAEIDKSGGLDDIKPFQDAFMQRKQDYGIFFAGAADIKFLNDHFFRVRFDMPPTAPTGDYTIRSYLIINDRLIDEDVKVLSVRQVGMNAFISNAAREHSFIYALVCIILALFSGWLVSIIKVRP